jgi:hypothetical protein
MVRKRHKPEEIVAKLRQVDVLVSQGRSVAEAIRSIGVTEVAERRTAEWRDFLHAAGGQSWDRELATALQQRAASCFSGLPAAGSGGVRARLRSLAACAHPTSSAGQAARGEKANAELTLLFPVRPDGACHQWRKVPSRELSIDLVADERPGRATGLVEAS